MSLSIQSVRAVWHRASLRPVWQPRMLIILPVAAIIGYLALVPLIYLLNGTFFESGAFSLDAFVRAYDKPGMGRMVWNSAVFTVGSGGLAIIVGTALAYLTTRTDAPFRKIVIISSLAPLILPTLIYTLSWIFLASPDIGLINQVLEPVFGPGTLNIYSMAGMIWVESMHLAPFAYLLMVAAFRSMDPALEEAAMMAGGGWWRVVRRVSLPLVLPAIASVGLIQLIRAVDTFEVPAMLGMPVDIFVFASRIYFTMSDYPQDLASAGALAVSVLLVAVVGLYLANRMARNASRFQTVTGKGLRPRRIRLGRGRPVAGFFILLYFFGAVLLPLLVLVWMSLLRYYRTPSIDALSGVSLDNFTRLADNSIVTNAVKNSLGLGLAQATIVMGLMAIGSWIVVRTRTPGRQIIDYLSLVPLVIPGLILSLAISFVYVGSSLPIYGTLLILLIAYCTGNMPAGMRYAQPAIRQIADELEECASVSGAGWGMMFRRIMLPLMMPGLIAGWIFIFALSFRELSLVILLYSPGNEVVPVLMWDQFVSGQLGQLAALGIVMIVALGVLVLAANFIGRRVGLRQQD
jgi:iron(III) transport system permease protein